jgi:HEPN domain-containing protein
MAMSLQEKFEYWLDVAESDLRAAAGMLDIGQWLYVAFMCQQAVEKLAKALYTIYLDDNPPRTHSIVTVFEHFSGRLPAAIPAGTRRLFDELSGYYLNNRYPDFRKKLSAQMDEAKAKTLLSQTQEVFAWLLTLKP